MDEAPTLDRGEDLAELLDSASRLQELVPDAVHVGGVAAILYAGHRFSYDHDHVVADLSDRFDVVLEALEREPGWVTNRTSYGNLDLEELGAIDTGVRQTDPGPPLGDRELLPARRALDHDPHGG